MQVWRSLDEVGLDDASRTVVTVGNFDGVHLGHQHVVARAREAAHELAAAHGTEVPRGEIGRLAVRGPTGCRYLGDLDRQRGYVENGWNVTGDSFREDNDGYFWYVARTDDKQRGRLNIISHLLSQVPYKPLVQRDITLPRRQRARDYVDPDLPLRYIPTPF